MVMKIKKIGRYLLDNQACEQKDVNAALEKQSNLENLGASGAPWAITTLQVLLVFAGGLGTCVVFKRIYRSFFNENSVRIPFAWRLPVILTTICYIWLFIAG